MATAPGLTVYPDYSSWVIQYSRSGYRYWYFSSPEMKRKRGKSLESVEISLEVCLTRAVALGTEPELTNGILAERTAG